MLPRAREGRKRAQRGRDVRRLRVVDVAHAGDVADLLDPVLDARETFAAPRRSRSSGMPAARAAAVAAAAFSRLCAPGISGSAGNGSSTANSTRRASPGSGRTRAGTIGDIVAAAWFSKMRSFASR